MNREEIARICKAMGDPNRLRIMTSLAEGEKYACRLLAELAITQPTLSHHLSVLSGSGLIHDRKEGRRHCYSLDCETIAAFKDFVQGLSCCGLTEAREIRNYCQGE